MSVVTLETSENGINGFVENIQLFFNHSYEIFDLLYGHFRDKFEEDEFIFAQKCVVSHQHFLNHLQEKFACHNSWTPFCFTYFDNNNGTRMYKFICKNEDEKRLYD